MKKIYFILMLFVLVTCKPKNIDYRTYINLSGSWQFAIDTANIGINQKWFLSDLSDSITLPGTTDSNQKGFLNKDTTTGHLNRVYKYEGAAWYRKKVVIPNDFQDKHITLYLERTKPLKIWVDSTFIGESIILQTPHEYDITKQLTPGEHYITLLIDNNLKKTPYGNVHIYSDDTETNWNGVIGQLFLVATPQTYISNLQVYPDIDNKKINIKFDLNNHLKFTNIDVELIVDKTINGKTKRLKSSKANVSCKPVLNFQYVLGDDCSLWDEYNQPLYSLTVVISKKDIKDSKTVPFGMRKFAVKGTQFSINGRTTFLRGKHDACVFPLTGNPPMDVEGWRRVYKIAKSYGINHYRFHSYCPPEAAFTAADQEGIYLQAEVPFWGGLDSDTLAEMLKAEGLAMLKAYANHPSFVMFSHGNEIWSGHDRVEKNIIAFKEYDDRPLYTMGSNNNGGHVPPRACSDYFVAARTPYAFDTILTHTRLIHGFVDSRDGGIINTQTPSTEIKFKYAVENMKIPVVGHEIGQYQTFPDYREIDKYTGVLRAWNLEVFRKRLEKAGILDQNLDFHKATGVWSAICYKAEMEAAIRTKGFAGFQLLDLQDFPGQGTALVGVLDAFMDSKEIVSREEWLQSCNDIMLLLEFPKFCWKNNEEFSGIVEVANYSNKKISKNLEWEVINSKNKVVSKGKFKDLNIDNEGLTTAGEIKFSLSDFSKAEKIKVNISLKGTKYSNSYPLWIYPEAEVVSAGDIIITEKLTDEVLAKLKDGAKVILFPATEDIKDKSFTGLFNNEFWNYGMFKFISEMFKKPISPGTMGILTNPDHPLFNSFPTDFHTNWQWFSIIKASNSLILDSTSSSYRPIVQVVDNLERNHKLGLIFEFKTGKGKLLVCMSQLNKIKDKPEAAQLYSSILDYTKSDEFNPDYELKNEEVKKLLGNK